MSKAKKCISVSVICVIIIAITMFGLYFFMNSIIPKTYSSAKKECEIILAKHQAQMEEVATNSLKSEKNASGNYLDYYYSCYQEEGCVKFDIGAQGMLGGQYWELVYTEDGNLYGESKSYFYEETGGNNIIKAEKLDNCWWFLWTDYDGTDRSYK